MEVLWLLLDILEDWTTEVVDLCGWLEVRVAEELDLPGVVREELEVDVTVMLRDVEVVSTELRVVVLMLDDVRTGVV